MAGSLIERLKNRIRDNLLDFLEAEPDGEAPSLENMSSSEIISRLKLRLGTIEAERYRLQQALDGDVDHSNLDARASAAIDAGDDRLAREILRLKVDQTALLSDAASKVGDLDLEAEDLQSLIALIGQEDGDVDATLEARFAKYEAAGDTPPTTTKKG